MLFPSLVVDVRKKLHQRVFFLEEIIGMWHSSQHHKYHGHLLPKYRSAYYVFTNLIALSYLFVFCNKGVKLKCCTNKK